VRLDVGAGLKEIQQALDPGLLTPLNRLDDAEAGTLPRGLSAMLIEGGVRKEEVASGIGEGMRHDKRQNAADNPTKGRVRRQANQEISPRSVSPSFLQTAFAFKVDDLEFFASFLS
jgi:hypothetical protein